MANKHIKRCSTSLRQYVSVVLSHLVCGNLFHQPHEVKMHTFVFCPVMSSTLWNRPLCMISLQNSYKLCHQFSSVQSSHSVMSNSLRPRGLQHARPPCPSPTPGVYSNSCPLSQSCHPTISSFVIPFSSHLQCFPASGSFQMSQLFTSGGQSIGVSASASVLPMNTQD